jgi:hypothetical protein
MDDFGVALRGPLLDLGDHEHKPGALVADLEQRRLPLATSRTSAGGSVLAAGFAGGAAGLSSGHSFHYQMHFRVMAR